MHARAHTHTHRGIHIGINLCYKPLNKCLNPQTHIHTCAHIEVYTCGLPDTPRQALCVEGQPFPLMTLSPLNALRWVTTYTIVSLGDFTAEEFHLFIRSLPDLQRNPKSPSWISVDKVLLPRAVSPCTQAFIFCPIFH